MIKAAEEKEMAEMENEVRKRERGEKERMGPKGDSNAAYLLPPASITADFTQPTTALPPPPSSFFYIIPSSHLTSSQLTSSHLNFL